MVGNGDVPNESDTEPRELSEIGLAFALDSWDSDRASPKKARLNDDEYQSNTSNPNNSDDVGFEVDLQEATESTESTIDTNPYPYIPIKSDRTQKQKYVLTAQMREAIINKNIDDATKEDIYNRLELLPLRIQDLITDIAVLSNSGSISDIHWTQIIVQSKGNKGDSYQKQKLGAYRGSDIYDAGRLGYKLGLAFRALQEAAGASTDWKNLTWGFVAAHIADTDSDSEKDNLEHLISHFESKFDERLQNASIRSDMAEHSPRHLDELHSLIRSIEPELTDEAATALTKRLEPFDEESESDIRQSVTEIVQSTRITDVCDLQADIEEDIRSLSSREKESVAIGILEIMLAQTELVSGTDTEDAVTKSRISEKLSDVVSLSIENNPSIVYDKIINDRINALVGNDENTQVNYPIIRRPEEADEYYLTDYGTILAICSSKRGGTSWMYNLWKSPTPDSGVALNWDIFIEPALDETEK